jgi:hypothetical protein
MVCMVCVHNTYKINKGMFSRFNIFSFKVDQKCDVKQYNVL